MSLIRRIVFDTSTLVSAALKPDSPPRKALLQALAHGDVCASAQTFLELGKVMQRDKFDPYLSRNMRKDFVVMLRSSLHFFAVDGADEAASLPACRDPKDQKFLALSLVCQADALVSSDDDLLVLNPWRDMPVLRPAAFLLQLEG